jgi:hypothetical protein
MIQIVIGSFVLSILHALIPNHWIPLVVIAKSEKWSRFEMLGATALAGLAHTASTILVGVFVGLIGYNLATHFELLTRWIAPSILLGLGLLYFLLDMRSSNHHHREIINPNQAKRTKFALLLPLTGAMFFSPCIEIESYYLIAGSFGWLGITLVSLVYLIVTVSSMVLLVNFGYKGVQKLEWHFLEHYEKRITGSVLIILGILAYFVKIG